MNFLPWRRRKPVKITREAAQAEIDGLLVAEMIQDFWGNFRGTYHEEVYTSSLCAVGPLQSMIGLAIKNGHLTVTPPETKP